MSKHTSTPWKADFHGMSVYDQRGVEITRCRNAAGLSSHANGNRIVKCVNAHEALIATLKTIATGSAMVGKENFNHADVVEAYQTLARKALKLAGEG